MCYKVRLRQLIIKTISLILGMSAIYEVRYEIERTRVWHYKYGAIDLLFDVTYVALIILFIYATSVYGMKAKEGVYTYHPRFGAKKSFGVCDIGKIVQYKSYSEIMDRNGQSLAKLDANMKGFMDFRKDMKFYGIQTVEGTEKTRYATFLKLRIVLYIFIVLVTYMSWDIILNPNGQYYAQEIAEKKYDGYYLYDGEVYYLMGTSHICKYVGGDHTITESDDGIEMMEGGWVWIDDDDLPFKYSLYRGEYYLGYVWDGTVDENYYPFEKDTAFWYASSFDYSYYDGIE